MGGHHTPLEHFAHSVENLTYTPLLNQAPYTLPADGSYAYPMPTATMTELIESGKHPNYADLIEAIQAGYDMSAANARDMDIAWLVLCGALVFFMQGGFAMLTAGLVHPKNVTNILFKNMMDASIAALCFWSIGYMIAYGEDSGGFIGTKHNFFLDQIYNNAGAGGSDGWEGWFFQWAFAGACATIVAGSVAERTKIEAYFIYSIILTGFIYPVVVHWGWGSGFLSAWGAYPDAEGNARPIFTRDERSNGMIDFAGSGIVHMVGGFSGFMGAIVVGPRKGRFIDGKVNQLYPGNHALQALGVFILWFGWYGFNCGSTLMISANAANVAGKVAVTTTIAAATGCITATLTSRVMTGHYDISTGLNGILAGLVSITANCSVVNPWHAFVIGMVGAWLLILGSKLLLILKVDDPCDACVVHGFCGVWGLWATGLFCTDGNVQYAAYPNTNSACKRFEQFGVQVVGSLVIIAWTCATTGLLFMGIKYTVGMRVDSEIEELGLDASEHGLPVYDGPGGGLGIGLGGAAAREEDALKPAEAAPVMPQGYGMQAMSYPPMAPMPAPMMAAYPMGSAPAPMY
jgi:Amt family ammonium transporter